MHFSDEIETQIKELNGIAHAEESIYRSDKGDHMAVGYYAGNGVYEYLTKCEKKDNFFWTSGTLWLLVYGDENFEPKVLTVASENKLGERTTVEEKNAVHAAQCIVKGTGVPINFIRFDPEKTMETIQYWEPGMKDIPEISSEGLKNILMLYGLKMNEVMVHKSINDKSSSPYHDWQRQNMGDSVVAADIDLVRHDKGKPLEIIELKRSYIDIDKWEPYQQDYKNFILISKLAKKRHIDFYIVYNRRIKKPFFDDVSRLKIFEFDHRMQPYCRLSGYKSIEQFAKNTIKENK